jgi:hypothetical protein
LKTEEVLKKRDGNKELYRCVIMTEIEKLSFEKTDFKFGIAYDNYMKKFDDATSEEERLYLNEIISKLSDGILSYPEFYERLNPSDEKHKRYHRMRISGTRKRAYQREERKVERIRRHK